jgi:hypothetical protein
MLCIKGFLELNDQRRDLLAAAIFVVENEIESKGGGQRHHPTVEALNAIRNRIYDDIGGNEWANRDIKDGGRFTLALEGVTGKRLTYKSLTGSELEGYLPKDRIEGSVWNARTNTGQCDTIRRHVWTDAGQSEFQMKQPREETIEIRVTAEEKEAFREIAELSGTSFSAWARERLRKSAAKELEAAGRKVPFYRHLVS